MVLLHTFIIQKKNTAGALALLESLAVFPQPGFSVYSQVSINAGVWCHEWCIFFLFI